MHRLVLFQTQTKSAESIAVQERSGCSSGRSRRTDAGPSGLPISRWFGQHQRRCSLRGFAGRYDAFPAAQSLAESPSHRSSADDRGTRYKSPRAGTPTGATTAGHIARACAPSPRLSRLPGPKGNTSRHGEALQSGLRWLPYATGITRQISGSSAFHRDTRAAYNFPSYE